MVILTAAAVLLQSSSPLEIYGVLFVCLAVAGVVAGVVLSMYNSMVRSRMRVREAWSGIDVQLKRRGSLVPNLVETVKSYAAHEHGVFEGVAKARSALQQASGPSDSAGANAMLSQALGRLFAVSERYPELQASEQFLELQRELTDTEQRIAYARQFYNQNVLDYNTRIQTYPGALLASAAGFAPADFFGAGEQAREDVKVDFSPKA